MSIYAYATKRDGKQYGCRFYVVENGKRVQKNIKGFKTQKEAKAAEWSYLHKTEREAEIRRATPDTEIVILFSEVYDLYKKYALDNLAPSTVYTYLSIAERYILPKWGDRDIRSITKKEITLWQDDLSSYSYKYKKVIRSTLSAIFTYALNRDYVSVNPVQGIEKIRQNEKKRTLTYWTKEEFDQFIEVVDDPLYKAMFAFLYTSGCRKGEAFALLWEDVDFASGCAFIGNSITKKGEILSREYGKTKGKQTKNKKEGTIVLPRYTLDLLKALKRKGKYVFSLRKDEPMTETTLQRYFTYYQEKAGVKRIRVHDLRHSCAALIISSQKNAGIDVLYAVAERLRDTPEQVLKTYGHLFPSRNAEIIDDFVGLFD